MRRVRKKSTIQHHKKQHARAEHHIEHARAPAASHGHGHDQSHGNAHGGHGKVVVHHHAPAKPHTHRAKRTKRHGKRPVNHWKSGIFGKFFLPLVLIAGFAFGGYYVTTRTFAEDTGGRAAVIETDKQLLDKYPGLPVAVARMINTVVATQRVIDAEDKAGEVASGVILGSEQVLTASHNVRAKNGTVTCGDMTVAATGLLTGAAASRDPVRFASSNKFGTSDLALLTVDGSANFESLPKAVIAKTSPQVGETVYFINFQPTADGKIRTPTNQASGDPNSDYSKPAILSGIVVSVTKDDIVVATGAGVSYGLGVKDVVVRKGASGGAVIDSRGGLVGLSVSSDSLEADATAASISKEYGQSLPEHQYQIAHVEPVSTSMLSDLETSLTSCE